MKILFILSGLMLGQNAMAQFGPQQIITTEAQVPRYVVTADIDSDGDIDVIAAVSGSDQTVWYKNLDGQANFGPLQVISTGVNDVRFVTTADIDGDGAIDVLATCPGDDMVLWNRNENGLGTFGSNNVIANDATEAIIADAGDLDGDGDLDVVSANRSANSISWYTNTDGAGNFGSEQVINSSILNARFVLVRDIDGDDDMDVLAVSTGLARVFWFENLDGNGNFSSPNELPGVASGTISIDSKDIDGDGDNDVIVASTTQNRLYWNENMDGLGTFSGEIAIDTRGSFVMSVFASDLDADSDIDVVSITTDGEVAWYENTDGLGTFGPAQIISLDADNGRGIFAADLDGDGDNDVLTASITGNKIAWYENLTILSVPESTLKTTILYPNPTSDSFTIETEFAVIAIHVYNALGQEVQVPIENNTYVSVATLSAGIYTVVVTGEDGATFSEKIVKN
jgi:hypothetical protein